MSAQIALPLTLRLHGDAASGKATAWFIPAADVNLWLAEIGEWNVEMSELRLLTVPIRSADLRPLGVLVVCNAKSIPNAPPSPLAQAYLCIADRLFIPASCRLHPPMSDDEIRHAMPLDVNVLHPTAGLIGSMEEELLGVSDLIDPPPILEREWRDAIAVEVPEARILSVRPASVPTMEQLLGEARDGIGTEQPTELPPLPSEGTIQNLIERGQIQTLSMVRWLAGASGMFQGLHNWSAARIRQLQANLEDARRREIARLMKLLETDPDEGLKFALPLQGGDSARGIAIPSARLGPRKVDFSLGGVNRSGPADRWNTDREAQERLRRKYRELANRELSLGRFRRAAYIFAELLGDYHAAASALKRGRYFREAAVLYRERLKNPTVAAQCLEEGGLLVEAIEIHISLGAFEKAGDLYRKLGEEEAAREHYTQAVQRMLGTNDSLGAASLSEKKLTDVDGALHILLAIPIGAPQGPRCVNEAFAVMGRHNRHDDAGAHVRIVRDRATDPILATQLIDVLAGVARLYPSSETRAAAADATRVVAGRNLPAADTSQSSALVSAVARVAVDDQLLSRDTRRYIELRSNPQTTTRPAPKKVPPKPVSLIKAIHLGAGVRWASILPATSTFYTRGVGKDELRIVQGDWNGMMRGCTCHAPGGTESSYRLLIESNEALTLVPVDSARRDVYGLLDFAPQFRLQTKVLVPPWLPPTRIFDMTIDDDGSYLVLHEANDGIVLSRYAPVSRDVTQTQVIPIHPDSPETQNLRMAVCGGKVCIIAGTRVFLFTLGHWPEPLEVGQPIGCVCVSAPHTRPRIVLGLEDGAAMIWPGTSTVKTFGKHLVSPKACLLGDGTLVAVDASQGVLYRVRDQEITSITTFPPPLTPPVAVVPVLGDHAERFAVLEAEGALSLYQTQ